MTTGTSSIGARLKTLGFKTYREYLGSRHWSDFKKRFYTEGRVVKKMMKKYGRRVCQSCGSSDRLEVHHWTYKRLGGEFLGDVKLICRECHEAVHVVHRNGTNLHRSTFSVIGKIRSPKRLAI
jgi:5-methylcytosine-specific restriction endonuclease McrA